MELEEIIEKDVCKSPDSIRNHLTWAWKNAIDDQMEKVLLNAAKVKKCRCDDPDIQRAKTWLKSSDKERETAVWNAIGEYFSAETRFSRFRSAQKKCPACKGSGWQWLEEIDPKEYHERAMSGRRDDTKYSCRRCEGSGRFPLKGKKEFMGGDYVNIEVLGSRFQCQECKCSVFVQSNEKQTRFMCDECGAIYEGEKK